MNFLDIHIHFFIVLVIQRNYFILEIYSLVYEKPQVYNFDFLGHYKNHTLLNLLVSLTHNSKGTKVLRYFKKC